MTDFKDIWGKYFFYYFSTKFYDRAMKMTAKATVDSVRLEMISEMDIKKPPQISEQKQIAEFFANLDNLITLHQRQPFLHSTPDISLSVRLIHPFYTSSWEQRKLGEMGQTYTGLSGKTKDDFGHGQARFVTYMNVFSNPISNPEMTEPIEIDPKQNEVEVGDVFFTTSSETPEEVGMSSILLEKREKTYLNSFCFGFRPSEKIDSYYLAYMLRSESARAKITLLAQGISRYNISKNKVMEIAVSLPSLDEQKMIGQYFSQLDNLITLHQRKCANLCSPSQVVFSLLFATSTFSWEQRKLGDISEIKTGPFGSTLHADDYVSDGTPIITTEHFKTGALPRSKNGLPQVSDSDYKRLTAYTLDDGDIVFSRVGSVDINALITPFQSNWLFSGRVLRVRPQTDISSKFLHTRLETESIKTDIRTRAVGQTMPSINTEILKITPLVLPSSAAEQEQIGSYFAALDNLITLHQRKPFLMKWRTSDANRNQTNRLVL